MEHLHLWTEFSLCALAVVLAGIKLVHYGDVLSEKLNLGKALVGMLLIGWATSLPEMVLSAGAILSIDSPDMAVGNIFGSLAFNLGILAIFAIVFHKYHPKANSPRTVTMSIAYSLLLIVVVLVALAIAFLNLSEGSFLSVAPSAWLILVIYLYSIFALYREDRRTPSDDVEESSYKEVSLGATLFKAFLAAGVIVAAGVYLAHTGDQMSESYGLSKSVVGIFFLAVVSSLPELATTITALKKGLFDMAVGNIFGSNIFNVAIIAMCDILYRKGALFAGLSDGEMPQQLTAGVITLLMTSIILAGFMIRRRKAAATDAKANVDMVLTAIVYVTGMVLLIVVFGSA
jgi:cation:H+ antiporter